MRITFLLQLTLYNLNYLKFSINLCFELLFDEITLSNLCPLFVQPFDFKVCYELAVSILLYLIHSIMRCHTRTAFYMTKY